MKRVLAFPPTTKVEWKSHDSSIQQRTAIEESRREKQQLGQPPHSASEKRTSGATVSRLSDLDRDAPGGGGRLGAAAGSASGHA